MNSLVLKKLLMYYRPLILSSRLEIPQELRALTIASVHSVVLVFTRRRQASSDRRQAVSNGRDSTEYHSRPDSFQLITLHPPEKL